MIIVFDFSYLQWETGGQRWTKNTKFWSALFHKNSNPSKMFQTNFLFARVLPLVRISAILEYIWGSKGPNISQKELLNAESVRKTLKMFNLTTTNAILMKYTDTCVSS